MELESIIIWIIVGAIAGLLAEAVVRGGRLGIIGAIIVGILGAIIGGWLFGVLNISIGGNILADIIVAFVGAVVLLLLLRAVRRV